jgi:hypothetical protein
MKLGSSTDVAADDEVRLSDGRLVCVRGADPAADRRADLFALQARLYKSGRINPLDGTAVRVVLSIVEIDGQAVPFPPCRPTREALQAYLKGFTRADLEALATAYDNANPGHAQQLLRPCSHAGPRVIVGGSHE